MKLWQKISLICSVILVVVVAVCSALLLGMAKEKLLTSAYERAETRQRELVNSFLKELDYYAEESDSDTVMHTLLNSLSKSRILTSMISAIPLMPLFLSRISLCRLNALYISTWNIVTITAGRKPM